MFLSEVTLMSRNVILTKPAFENLIQHLVNIENEKKELVERFFPRPSKERIKFRSLLDNYITGLDFLIKYKISVGEKSDNSFPFAIINCDIAVQDVKTNEKLNYKIVSPDTSKKVNDVSFLSPVGRSLLMKEVGDEVTIETPGGKLQYNIQSIKLAF